MNFWKPVNHQVPDTHAIEAFDLFMAAQGSTAHKMLPTHMIPGLARWVLWAVPPGNFLKRLLLNQFVEAVLAADDDNAINLGRWARFLYNDMPGGSWGSEAQVKAWTMKGGAFGRCALCNSPMDRPARPETRHSEVSCACVSCLEKHAEIAA